MYTSGVDQKVVQYSLVRLQKKSSDKAITTKQWAQTSSRRLHSHDVRALALWPPYSNVPTAYRRTFSSEVAPVLASAGLDMSVVLTPAASPSSSLTKTINPLRTSLEANFGDAYHRRLAYSTGRTVSIAKSAGLVASFGDAHVSIWQIKRVDPESSDDSEPDYTRQEDKGGWHKVLEMDLNVQTNLVTCQLSDNGKWLILSDWYETKLFSLETDVSVTVLCWSSSSYADFSWIYRTAAAYLQGGYATSQTYSNLMLTARCLLAQFQPHSLLIPQNSLYQQQ